jgi:hypothetical protein
MDARQMERLSSGKLPTYSSVESYTLLYLTQPDNDTLCAECATTEIDTTDTKVICDAHWEGDPETCDECGKQIESSYGPVENETATTEEAKDAAIREGIRATEPGKD